MPLVAQLTGEAPGGLPGDTGWQSIRPGSRGSSRPRRKGFDLAIIDTPGVDTPATTAAMHAADLCLVPARPSVADIEAARPTIRTLSALGKPFLSSCTKPAGPKHPNTRAQVRTPSPSRSPSTLRAARLQLLCVTRSRRSERKRRLTRPLSIPLPTVILAESGYGVPRPRPRSVVPQR